MRIKYTFDIVGDSSKLIPSVDEVFTSINKTMESFGYSEKIVLYGTICTGTMTSERELTPTEIKLFIAMTENEYSKSKTFGKCNCKVENFRKLDE